MRKFSSPLVASSEEGNPPGLPNLCGLKNPHDPGLGESRSRFRLVLQYRIGIGNDYNKRIGRIDGAVKRVYLIHLLM